MGISPSTNITTDTSFCYAPYANTSCFPDFPIDECSTVQEGSYAEMAAAAWDGACSCAFPSGVVDSVPTFPVYNCSGTLSAYRYRPLNEAQARTCDSLDSGGSMIGTSIVLALNFAVPLAGFFAMLIVRHERKKLEPPQEGENARMLSAEGHGELHKNPPACYVSFQNLKYAVKLNSEAKSAIIEANGGNIPTSLNWDIKYILKGLTGCFVPGSLSAIMGPSGCGKSTLLDALADRKHDGYTTGSILVNGEPRSRYYKRLSAYVMQSDALFPYLSVFELLMYTAELRLSGKDRNFKFAAVDKVIRDLDLVRVRDSKIGGTAFRGISGGQARRVTVAVELLTRPSILFLDEPTTGLDAYSSLQLVRTLRMLADDGRTVICTIHQPRPDIFTLFNNLLLMKAGEIAYFGPVQEISSYFASHGITIPVDVNAADFVVDLTYAKETPKVSEGEDAADGLPTISAVDMLVENYSKSTLYANTQALVSSLFLKTMSPPPENLAAFFEGDRESARKKSLIFRFNTRYSQPLNMQVYILLRRSYLNISRNTSFFVAVALQSLQFLFYGLLFLGLRFEPSTEPDIFGIGASSEYGPYDMMFQKRNFLFQVMNTMCIVESVVIATAFLEKRIFLREHASGAYSVLAYHAQWIIRLSVDAIWKGIFASILCYFLPPMRLTAGAFFYFCVNQMVNSTVGSSLAFFMVSAVPDAEGASNIHNTIIGFMGTYAGFFLLSRFIPYATIFAYYISFLSYSFEGLEWNEFGPCASLYEKQITLSLDTTLNRWTNLLVLMVYPIIFHLLALLSSFARTRPRSFWETKCSCCFKRQFENMPSQSLPLQAPEQAGKQDNATPETVVRQDNSTPETVVRQDSAALNAADEKGLVSI